MVDHGQHASVPPVPQLGLLPLRTPSGRLQALIRPLPATSCDKKGAVPFGERWRISGMACQIGSLKLLHCCMEPLFSPRMNHVMRCCEVPWVKLSGTAKP